MICPKCQAEGRKSKVYVGAAVTTCMGVLSYYDEYGNHHCHDPNTTHREFRCSNGHEFTQVERRKCWCGEEGP